MVIMDDFYDQNLIMNLLEFETENEDDLKRLKDLFSRYKKYLKESTENNR